MPRPVRAVPWRWHSFNGFGGLYKGKSRRYRYMVRSWRTSKLWSASSHTPRLTFTNTRTSLLAALILPWSATARRLVVGKIRAEYPGEGTVTLSRTRSGAATSSSSRSSWEFSCIWTSGDVVRTITRLPTSGVSEGRFVDVYPIGPQVRPGIYCSLKQRPRDGHWRILRRRHNVCGGNGRV